MRQHKLTCAALLVSLLLAGCGSQPAVTQAQITSAPVTSPTAAATEAETAASTSPVPHSGLLDCLYYEDRDFHTYDERSVIYELDGAALCGVAPHHLTAGHMIAGMYRTAAQRGDIDTVVLIAPMHYDSAHSLTTSMKGWSTAFGSVTNDTEITELFVNELGAAKDDYMTEFDHSASSHIPFIKKYLPDAKVSCLLVSPKERGDLPERLSELLCEISRMRNCFFAFSIDFSHYLDPDEATLHDKETLDAVLAGNTPVISHFTNSNVDTPYCLNTFVMLSELLGGTAVKADNANTFTVTGLPYSRTIFPEGVTSYFVFFSVKEVTGS